MKFFLSIHKKQIKFIYNIFLIAFLNSAIFVFFIFYKYGLIKKVIKIKKI